MTVRRTRIKHDSSLETRLMIYAQQVRETALRLPPGKQREMLLRQAQASETAAKIEKWICSPGLRPPD